jgi:hypothetical protein
LENDRVLLNTLPVNYLKVKQMTVFLIANANYVFGNDPENKPDLIPKIELLCKIILKLSPNSSFSLHHSGSSSGINTAKTIALNLPIEGEINSNPDLKIDLNRIQHFYDSVIDLSSNTHSVIGVAFKSDLEKFAISADWTKDIILSNEHGVIEY